MVAAPRVRPRFLPSILDDDAVSVLAWPLPPRTRAHLAGPLEAEAEAHLDQLARNWRLYAHEEKATVKTLAGELGISPHAVKLQLLRMALPAVRRRIVEPGTVRFGTKWLTDRAGREATVVPERWTGENGVRGPTPTELHAFTAWLESAIIGQAREELRAFSEAPPAEPSDALDRCVPLVKDPEANLADDGREAPDWATMIIDLVRRLSVEASPAEYKHLLRLFRSLWDRLTVAGAEFAAPLWSDAKDKRAAYVRLRDLARKRPAGRAIAREIWSALTAAAKSDDDRMVAGVRQALGRDAA